MSVVDPLLTKTREELAQGPGRAHSTLFDWLYRHRAALARDFEDTPPSWPHMAKLWAEAGLTDRNGKPPTAHTAGQTWRRVLQVAERKRAKEAIEAIRKEERSRQPVPGVRVIEPGEWVRPEATPLGDPMIGAGQRARANQPASEEKPRDPILDKMDEFQRRKGYW